MSVKKRYHCQKKSPNTKTTSWKVIVSINIEIYFLAPRVGYFAHMDLKQNWNILKSMPTGSVAINIRFLGVIDPKPNLNGKH